MAVGFAALAKVAKVARVAGRVGSAASSPSGRYILVGALSFFLTLPIMLALFVLMLLPGGGDQRVMFLLRDELIGAGVPDGHIEPLIDAGNLCEQGDARFIAAMIQANYDNESQMKQDQWPLKYWAQIIDEEPLWTAWWQDMARDMDGNGRVDPLDALDFIDWMGQAQCQVFEHLQQRGYPLNITYLYYGFLLGAEHGAIVPDMETPHGADAFERFKKAVYEFGWLAFVDLSGEVGLGVGPGAWGGHANGQIPVEELCPIPFAGGHFLRCDVAAALIEMNNAYRADHDGRNLAINSTYRPLQRQKELKITRGRFAATPGTSNHGWGTAIDFGRMGRYNLADYYWIDYYTSHIDARFTQPTFMRQGGSLEEPWHWEYGTRGPKQ